MEKSFKKEKDGSYQLLIDDQKSGIFLHIPDSYKIADYNIVLTGDEFKPSKRAHFTFLEAPSKMGEIKIDAGADICFKKGINISVKQFLRLGKNDNFLVDAYSSTSVTYEELEIANNKDTTITLVRENPRPSLLDETGTIPIVSTSIKNNNFCMFDIGTEVQQFTIDNNQTHKDSNVPFKLSVVGADYLVIENNRVTPDSKGSVIFVETAGGFLLKNTNIELRDKNFIRNIYQPSNKGELPILTMRDGNLKFANAVVETNATSFVVNPKDKTVAFGQDIKIKTDKSVTISERNSLENVSITCMGTSIALRDNYFLEDSIVNFVPETKATSARTILKSSFTNAKITNVVDDLNLFINRSHRNSERIVCDNLSMRGESSDINILLDGAIFYNSKIYMPITLEGIALDAHSKLKIKIDPGADDRERMSFPVELKNINVEGESSFDLFQGIKAENCSFKKLLYIATLNDKNKAQELDNVICEGVVALKNVEKISRCDMKNLELSNEKETLLRDEFFNDQKISNYDAFIQKRDGNGLSKEGNLATDDLELL